MSRHKDDLLQNSDHVRETRVSAYKQLLQQAEVTSADSMLQHPYFTQQRQALRL
jgi:hypothetical protein